MRLLMPSRLLCVGIAIFAALYLLRLYLTTDITVVFGKDLPSNITVDRQVLEKMKKDLQLLRDNLQLHTTDYPWTSSSIDVLDKTIETLESITKPNKEHLEDATKDSEVPDVCPDRYVHANLSEPYFLNGSWVNVKCGREKSIRDILTFLLYPSRTRRDCRNHTENLIQQIQSIYPGIRIVIATGNKSCMVNKRQNVTQLYVSQNEPAGKTWNRLVTSAKTKYVLLGRGLDTFSWLTRVNRQLAVLSDVRSRKLNIVGGAFRNETGHWEVGCYQSRLKFYQLIYSDGYYKSKNECMFCGYLRGPFVARTSLFKSNAFDESMPEGVVFEDFFLRMNQSDTVMACPDAMYFATDPTAQQRTNNRKTWLALVKKMQLHRVVLPDGIRHKFTCEETATSCDKLIFRVSNQYMPVCCMDRAMAGYKAFHEYCVKHKLLYYAIGGSALGAIKFRNMIPWDFDGDLQYYSSNLSFFKGNKKAFGNGKTLYFGNFHLKRHDYFQIFTPEFIIEMFGIKDTAIEHTGMTELFHSVPTKIRIRGEWLYGPPSPGLYARNQYGRELYKHANSWYNQGRLWFEPYKLQSSFPKCSKPGYHYCYDKYPTDGSFYFTVP